MNNYEILNRPSGDSIEDARQHLEAKRIPKRLARLDSQPSETNFADAVTSFAQLLALHHLGAASSRPPLETAKAASRLARDYFGTPWYANDPDEADAMRKEPDNEELPWFGMLTEGLLTAALADDQETLRVLGDWVECWLVPEFADPPTDPLLGKTFVSIGAAFRSEPLSGLDELEAEIRGSRRKQPKLLFETWEAVRDHDQAAFDETLLKAVLHFEKTMREPGIPEDAIAFHQSTVLAVARHYGLSLPDYEPRIMARLVCHESLGIPLPTRSER